MKANEQIIKATAYAIDSEVVQFIKAGAEKMFLEIWFNDERPDYSRHVNVDYDLQTDTVEVYFNGDEEEDAELTQAQRRQALKLIFNVIVPHYLNLLETVGEFEAEEHTVFTLS